MKTLSFTILSLFLLVGCGRSSPPTQSADTQAVSMEHMTKNLPKGVASYLENKGITAKKVQVTTTRWSYNPFVYFGQFAGALVGYQWAVAGFSYTDDKGNVQNGEVDLGFRPQANHAFEGSGCVTIEVYQLRITSLGRNFSFWTLDSSKSSLSSYSRYESC